VSAKFQNNSSNIQATWMICFMTEYVLEPNYKECISSLHIIANFPANIQPKETKICRSNCSHKGKLSKFVRSKGVMFELFELFIYYYSIFNSGILLLYCTYSVCPVNVTVTVIVKCFEILLGFTLGAKLVSSKHLTQVHLKISSLTLENLAAHLMTKYITWTCWSIFALKVATHIANAIVRP